jgi:hypothetical protein
MPVAAGRAKRLDRLPAKKNGGGRAGFAGRPEHDLARRASSACECEIYARGKVKMTIVPYANRMPVSV